MAKLYKAVDKDDVESGDKCWLVNQNGVAVSFWADADEAEIESNKLCEMLFSYDDISLFEHNAINPILIAEW